MSHIPIEELSYEQVRDWNAYRTQAGTIADWHFAFLTAHLVAVMNGGKPDPQDFMPFYAPPLPSPEELHSKFKMMFPK